MFFEKFKKLYRFFIKLIYPDVCIICKHIISDNSIFCPSCWKNIQFISKPYCSICCEPFEFAIGNELICGKCLRNKPNFDKARVAFIYNDYISRAILAFKFHQKTFLAKIFANFILRSSKDIIDEIDYLIPVPLHIKRLRWRGYNQSLLLANEVGKLSNKPVINDLLKKAKSTMAQASLKSKERKRNLKNAFTFNELYKNTIKNKTIAIVDDVLTTGTTLNECSKILKKYKAKQVFVLVIAKTSFKKRKKPVIYEE